MPDAPLLSDALARVCLRMTSELDPTEVLRAVVAGLVEELDAALARIWLLEPGATNLHLVASAGLSTSTQGGHREIAVGALKIGGIAATRAAVCTNDVRADPRVENKVWVERERLQAFAGYPLQFRDELLGVLGLFSRRALTTDEFERLGAFAAQAAIAIKNARLFEETAKLSLRLQDENSVLKEELRDARPARPILGQSPAIREALLRLQRVAVTDTTVLLQGETGTGKELFARALHETSARSHRPLVKVNCAAISPTLIESELFGHEKGAFTSALQRHRGRFELAEGGTLFLDEIGELPVEAQAKLLRVLQEHELERVGGTQTIRVDVRIVCATNRDLAADVRERRFRSDLFYRINVFPIHVPPLRERRSDVPLLANAILADLSKRLGRHVEGIAADAMASLCAYDWPGNVRELENAIERAVIVASGARLTIDDFADFGGAFANVEDEAEAPAEAPATPTHGGSLRDRLTAYEREILEDALRRAKGNQTEAARLLRLSRATLQYRMRRHGL
ncbi:MAG TPA: sigma 54-interacting transcriptional regulator [Polyangiaceae bacterium]